MKKIWNGIELIGIYIIFTAASYGDFTWITNSFYGSGDFIFTKIFLGLFLLIAAEMGKNMSGRSGDRYSKTVSNKKQYRKKKI